MLFCGLVGADLQGDAFTSGSACWLEMGFEGVVFCILGRVVVEGFLTTGVCICFCSV